MRKAARDISALMAIASSDRGSMSGYGKIAKSTTAPVVTAPSVQYLRAVIALRALTAIAVTRQAHSAARDPEIQRAAPSTSRAIVHPPRARLSVAARPQAVKSARRKYEPAALTSA